MANEPTQVDLLDKTMKLIQSFTGSQPGSLNYLGSENTRYVRIIGPAGSAVTVYDDQKFRRDENLQTIQKTTDNEVIAPVAVQLLPGEQQEGVYNGSAAEYDWALFKIIKTSWWQSTGTAIFDGFDAVVGLATGLLTLDPFLGIAAYEGLSGVTGAMINGGGTSADNCTDNISSLAFGFPLPAPQ